MSLALRWSHAGGDECLRVDGFRPEVVARLARADPDEIGRLLPVYPGDAVGGPAGDELRARFPSTRGRYVVEGGGVCFLPRFPFRDGTTYRVLVAPDLVPRRPIPGVDLDGFLELSIERVPGVGAAVRTQVLGVEPTAAILPRNHLRFYVGFSAPMSEGQAAEHVHLRRAGTGDELRDVFLAFDPELWDGSRTRLTVLLDPARIKRGLAPHREIGYPLAEGDDVELVVDAAFRDARGAPLASGCVRGYRIGPDIRSRVDPSAWSFGAPGAGTLDPLVVRFDRPLDRALLGRCLRVVDERGDTVRGAGRPADGDGEWSFRPYDEWRPAPYELVVDAILEDVAGNSVARVFDRDVGDPSHEPRDVAQVRIGFVPT